VTTCDDLRHGESIPGRLTVTVSAVASDPVAPRSVELTATDAAGTELTVVLWETHAVGGDWSVGETYELAGGRVKRYPDASGPTVRVHSTDEFEVSRVDPGTDATSILAVGDSVGVDRREL
jgi:hypothetical protein